MMSVKTGQLKSGLCLVLIMVLIPVISLAQSDIETSGYAAYMNSIADKSATAGTDQNHMLQTRLNAAWYASDSLTMVSEFRFRGYHGDAVDSNPNFVDQITSTYDDPTLDVTLWDGDNSFGYGQVDRFYLDYFADPLQITIGRQRIAWGATLVWNVIDLFNSGSLLDLSYEEGAGTDAVRVQFYTGPVSKIELAVKPADDRYNGIVAALWRVNIGLYDLSVIAARKDNRNLVGGGWAGSILDAGFRGEFSITEAPKKGKASVLPIDPVYGESLYASDDSIMSLSMSADYTFENTFYIHSELLYNSNGKTRNAGAFTYQALEAGMLSPSRLSFFQEFSYNLTPLWRTSLFAIMNTDDRSWVLVPNLTWSAQDNLDMTLTGYLADGSAISEWGSVSNTLIWQVKYSF